MINIVMMILITMFYIIFIRRSIMLIVTGISPFVLGAGKKGIAWIVEIGFFAGLLLWTFEIAVQVFKINFNILPGFFFVLLFNVPAVRITGLVLIALAILVFSLSLVSFGRSWRVGVDMKNPGELITKGIFRFSRNPIFLSIHLIFLGTFLVFSNLFFLAAFAIIIPGIHYQNFASSVK